MMSTDDKCQSKREALARIAKHEGQMALAGNEDLSGEAIEKYLGVFREAFNSNGGDTRYSDPRVGYPWCCAFVYYCCLQAGFTFPPKPILEHRWTLGAVPVWRDWAVLPQNDFYFPPGDCQRKPQPGDIILFDRLLEDKDLDHIGIVVDVTRRVVVTAEGNVRNKSGIFERPLGVNTNGYIRLAGL
jgi:hypothetical protein